MKECENQLTKFSFEKCHSIYEIAAEECGFRAGWRAALEWALSRECDDAILSCEIEQELEEVT